MSGEDVLHRHLAASGGVEEPLDYSVVSVGVMTLGLLLFVEVIRHHLDHAAIGRPFFKAVLEGVYSECTFDFGPDCICIEFSF
jgi:hypothetical protein